MLRSKIDDQGLPALAFQYSALIDWLFREALPLWSVRGVDQLNGGFHEKLAQNGNVVHEPRRTRLVSRQIYVFSTAVVLGWPDSKTARELVHHGLDFLLSKCISGSGTVYSAVSPTGEPIRPDFDLYDHAFALFALGHAARFGYRPDGVIRSGNNIINAMRAGWKHPLAGFEESAPPREPLNSNQHMHLLEAFLEWEESEPGGEWASLVDETAELAITKFIDQTTGGVREHYDRNWRPAQGEIGRFLEPGHQFEWSWLLWRWAKARGRSDITAAVRTLVQIGETCGISRTTGLAVNGIWDDLSMRDANSRLWPQTERIKAHIAMAELADTEEDKLKSVNSAVVAAVALRRYFDTDIPGLWHEVFDEEGRPVLAPAKASSLYHIVCAISELGGFLSRQRAYG